MDEFARSSGAQKRLKMSRSGLEYLRLTGRIHPAFEIDGERIYRVADLEALARKRELARLKTNTKNRAASESAAL